MNQGTHFVYIILTLTILICGMILWFWWRNRITQEYLKKLRERDVQALNEQLAAQQEEIARLTAQNEELSKLVHRDNKLLPALDRSVKEFLVLALREENRDALVSGAKELIRQLDQRSEERAGAVRSYELSHKRLPPTGAASLDAVLSYLLQRATDADIALDLSISGDVTAMIGAPVTEEDTATLLADLLENAMIATKPSRNRRLLVELGQLEGVGFLSVSDSGSPFPAEVLANWGIKRITSHPDSGGSGIGMMTTFELCGRYDASFSIEEFAPGMLYAKRVSVRFDGAHRYQLKLNDEDRLRQALENPYARISM